MAEIIPNRNLTVFEKPAILTIKISLGIKLMRSSDHIFNWTARTTILKFHNLRMNNQSLPTLHYFQIRGNCQPARHLLWFLQINFHDHHEAKTPETQVQCGFDMGLPYLQDGPVKVYELIAIMMYLCKKNNHHQLIGLTPQHSAKINQSLFKYSIQRKKIMGCILEGLRIFQEEGHRAERVEVLLNRLVLECKFIDFCLKMLCKHQKWIFGELSIVDFIFYETCVYINGFYGAYIPAIAPWKYFKIFKANFQELSFYDIHRKQIEQYPLFFQFSNKKMNEMILRGWKGKPIPVFKSDIEKQPAQLKNLEIGLSLGEEDVQKKEKRVSKQHPQKESKEKKKESKEKRKERRKKQDSDQNE